MAGKILTWRENSAASQSKRAWNAPWNAPSPPRIFSCRHDNVMTTRDKKEKKRSMEGWVQKSGVEGKEEEGRTEQGKGEKEKKKIARNEILFYLHSK